MSCPGTPARTRACRLSAAHALQLLPSMRALTCALLALAACGDDAATPPAAGGDAAPTPDAGFVAMPRTPDPDATFEMLVQKLELYRDLQKIPGLGVAVIRNGTTKTAVLGKRQSGGCEPFTSKTRIRLGRPTRTLV